MFDVTHVGKSGPALLMGELVEDGQRLVVATGGQGGTGNVQFATAVNREPRLAEAGECGVTRMVRLELKLLADVVLIGLPNVGKSSLLAALSGARPRVAEYPFATTEPVRGVMQLGYRALVAVDMPSLMEGAHAGRGLGNAFLRHAERAKIIAHVLDGTRASVIKDVEAVNREIALFSPDIARRPQVVVVNKLDLPGVEERREEIEAEIGTAVSDNAPVLFVSATEGTGTATLLEVLFQVFDAAEPDGRGEAAPGGPTIAEGALPILKPQRRAEAKSVVRVGDAFRITHPRAVRIARGSDLDDWTARLQYHGELARLGVTRRLEELGIQPGDTVTVGDLEFQWE